jgi:hypothetical protein
MEKEEMLRDYLESVFKTEEAGLGPSPPAADPHLVGEA